MKIGIDLDGTAWDHRELFRDLILGLQNTGHQVGILTAHVNLIYQDLDLWSKRRFPAPDFYCSKKSGEESIPSKEWKIKAAKELGLDYIFDDFDTRNIQLVRIGNE